MPLAHWVALPGFPRKFMNLPDTERWLFERSKGGIQVTMGKYQYRNCTDGQQNNAKSGWAVSISKHRGDGLGHLDQ
jgi:hypothetical protein